MASRGEPSAGMDTPWRIELLGRLRATQGERVVTRFRARKTGALLAYLAYHLDRPHPREVLIELLWPETEPHSGRNNLSRELNSLRRQLEPPGVPAGAIIVADRNTVQLNPAACVTDVRAFAAALETAARASSTAERVARLTEAAELYQCELLPGYFEDWILPERQRLVEAYLQALEPLIGHLEQAGELAQALDYARRAAAVDPLREASYGPLIRLLAASGQPEAARRAYCDLEQRLRQELGEPVSATTRQLIRDLEWSAVPGRDPSEREGPGSRQEGGFAPLSTPSPLPAGPELPRGTVTFLLTDIVRSTALWEQSGPSFRSALTSHHELLRREFQRHGGREVKEAGDSFVVAFTGAADALACALAAQRALAAHAWPEEVGRLEVRMALHTGDVKLEKGEYRSLVLHHAARMLAAAHGGQIVCSEVTASLLRRSSPGTLEAGVQLADLGLYRLRDITTPQRLFQASYPGMAQQEFPPPNALPAHEGHLPLQFTRFFGREEEIARLRELLSPRDEGQGMRDGKRPSFPHPSPLAPRSSPLVTLTGPGGSGKTRLALEVAGQLRTPLHGAVWFVPLQDLTDARLIPDKLLDALRLPRCPQVQPIEQAVAFLSRQPSLLLLDNFEHLVTHGTPLVQTLLEQVPSLTCLVTSRQRLNLAGEREFPVAPLPVPVDGKWLMVDGPAQTGSSNPSTISHEPSTLTQCPSVALFLDRAQAARPDFQVTKRNAAVVARICARLEGLPLALELAAARAGVLAPAQMLARLSQRFELLASTQRGATPRHRSLWAALEWSYQLLSPELQRFFAQLSVFQGGWTLEAAEAVCGGEGVRCWVSGVRGADADLTPNTQHLTPSLDCLEQLRECSLVQAAEFGGEMRFRLLETLREFGAEQLSPEERAAGAHRHAAYYLALAERAEPELSRADQAAWLDWLEREQENLRAALGWLEASGRIQDALRLEGALWHFRVARGGMAEGLERLRRLLTLPGAEQGTLARAKALNGAGVLAEFVLEHETSRRLHEEGLAIARELDDRGNIAFSLTGLGHTLDSLSFTPGNEDYLERARSVLEEGLTIWQEVGDPWGVAYALNGLGWVACNQHDYDAAWAHWRECLRVRREQGNQWGVALTLFHLGVLAQQRENGAEARSHWQECLAVAQKTGDRYQMGQTLLSLGNLAYREGDLSTARSLLEEGLLLVREVGVRHLTGAALSNLAAVAGDQGELATASAYLEQAIAIYRLTGDRPGIASSLHKQGRIAQQQGNLGAAGACFAESLSLSRELGNRQSVADCLESLAAVAAGQGHSERACRLFGAAAALREAGGWPLAPVYQSEYERQVAAVRDALGEEAFAAAWAEGRAMAPEQAAAFALE